LRRSGRRVGCPELLERGGGREKVGGREERRGGGMGGRTEKMEGEGGGRREGGREGDLFVIVHPSSATRTRGLRRSGRRVGCPELLERGGRREEGGGGGRRKDEGGGRDTSFLYTFIFPWLPFFNLSYKASRVAGEGSLGRM
jgi:hypothetical protein